MHPTVTRGWPGPVPFLYRTPGLRADKARSGICSAAPRDPEEPFMCGIVGIVGREGVAGHLVEALRRLEYRGYDSAGVATLEHGRLERRRAEGKLVNLEAKL